MIDYTTLSGAEFRRAVGTDPDKWAEAMLQTMQRDDAPTADAARIAFVAAWFLDAMRAAVASELMEHWKRDPVGAMKAQREANSSAQCAAPDASDSA